MATLPFSHASIAGSLTHELVAGEHGVGADHWYIHQLLWRPHHHWSTLQVLGPTSQLWPKYLLHHIHLGAGTHFHAHFGVPVEAGDSRLVDLWGCVLILRLGPVVCAVQ